MHIDEVHYLEKKANPNYKEFATEPRLWAAEPPVTAWNSMNYTTRRISGQIPSEDTPTVNGTEHTQTGYMTDIRIANAESGFPFVSASNTSAAIAEANGPYINGIAATTPCSQPYNSPTGQFKALCVMHRYSNLPRRNEQSCS